MQAIAYVALTLAKGDEKMLPARTSWELPKLLNKFPDIAKARAHVHAAEISTLALMALIILFLKYQNFLGVEQSLILLN